MQRGINTDGVERTREHVESMSFAGVDAKGRALLNVTVAYYDTDDIRRNGDRRVLTFAEAERLVHSLRNNS